MNDRINKDRLKSGSGRQKDKIRALLLDRNLDKLLNWAPGQPGSLRILTSLLFDQEPLVAWRAIEATGKLSALTAHNNLEKIRKYIRRLFWMMNDESGGLCRRAPEAIAEILVNVPILIDEYAHILASFLREEPFEQGVRFAIYRLATARPESRKIFVENKEELIKSLKHADAYIRGYSYLALKALDLNPEEIQSAMTNLAKTVISIYDFNTGELELMTIQSEV